MMKFKEYLAEREKNMVTQAKDRYRRLGRMERLLKNKKINQKIIKTALNVLILFSATEA